MMSWMGPLALALGALLGMLSAVPRANARKFANVTDRC